jgi:hypothetical protein
VASAPEMSQALEKIHEDHQLLRNAGGSQEIFIRDPQIMPMLQKVPSAPTEMNQEIDGIMSTDLRSRSGANQELFSVEGEERLSMDSQVVENKVGIGLAGKRQDEEAQEFLMQNKVMDMMESPVLEVHGAPVMQKTVKFAQLQDGSSPRMYKIKHPVVEPLNVQGGALEISMENVVGTPQGPETPRQVGEFPAVTHQDVTLIGGLKDIPIVQELETGGVSSFGSSSGKELEVLADANLLSVLKGFSVKGDGKLKKVKEKKSVTFASLKPSEEDLALIREDWRDAACSGCIGCGKEGCNGQCLSPATIKPKPDPDKNDASCSSSTNTVHEKFFSDTEATSTGSFKWARGELLGEGAYGKVPFSGPHPLVLEHLFLQLCFSMSMFLLPMLLYLDLVCWDLRVLGFHATNELGSFFPCYCIWICCVGIYGFWDFMQQM